MRRILIPALIALIATSCATGTGQLGAASWQVIDLNGVPVTGERPVTLVLDGDGRISGNASCNSYSGTYEMSSRQGIRLTPSAVTRMLCQSAEVMEQERRFLGMLAAIEGYNRYSNGDLSLIAGDGSAIRLRRN